MILLWLSSLGAERTWTLLVDLDLYHPVCDELLLYRHKYTLDIEVHDLGECALWMCIELLPPSSACVR